MIGDLATLAFLIVAPLPAGWAVGWVADAVLNLRDLARTGHESACPAPAGWACTCRRDSGAARAG